jgi:hypothetical protein
MLRILTAVFLASILISHTAFAEESKGNSKSGDFARYGVSVAGSLFGPSASFNYNKSRKTTFVFGMGAFSGDAPMDPKIGDNTYTMSGSASWMGFFVNHRPFDNARWFRLAAGFAVGNIDNELKDSTDANNSYQVLYSENPVGYFGIGFGLEAKKGFLWGVDIGLLQTGGSTVTPTGSASTPNTVTEIKDNWMFGSILPNFQLSLGWGF